MTKIEISQATGIVLDYLVAVCEGWNYVAVPDTFNSGRVYHMMQKGEEIKPLILLQYSSDWGLAGPILDREDISFD
ncbi:MAG TPA: phage protein NinX family protein, partial [Methanosarcina sp.]|nr:phage protein NinX family protein [Methanosarcina sp.]